MYVKVIMQYLSSDITFSNKFSYLESPWKCERRTSSHRSTRCAFWGCGRRRRPRGAGWWSWPTLWRAEGGSDASFHPFYQVLLLKTQQLFGFVSSDWPTATSAALTLNAWRLLAWPNMSRNCSRTALWR